MASVSERVPAKSRSRTVNDTFELWNRKLHYYIGLYLLFFIWLFAFSGLLLNHGWKFAEFWPQRKETTTVRSIQAPPAGADLDRARNLMRQLDISGEVEWPRPNRDPAHFDFRVSRPGTIHEVKADFTKGRATVQRVQVNAWGIIHVLHTFSGVRIGDPRMQRDWLLTSIWSFSMDALSAGLIFMVFSSYYMWYRLKPKRRLGIIVLGLGVLSCGFFVTGLAWLAQIR